MKDYISQPERTSLLERTSFDLGLQIRTLKKDLLWFRSGGKLDDRMPAKVYALDLPEYLLHPFQGVSLEYLRARRKRLLEKLSATCNLVKTLQFSGVSIQPPSGENVFTDLLPLFGQLDRLETENSLENQRYLDSDGKKVIEQTRAAIESKVVNLLNSFDDWLDHLESMLPESARLIFELGSGADELEQKLESTKDNEDSSNEEVLNLQQRIFQLAQKAESHVPGTLIRGPKQAEFSQRGNKKLLDHLISTIKQGLEQDLSQALADNSVSHFPFPNFTETERPPESPEDWEQLAKKPILFKKQEISLTPQSRLLLLKLLSSRNNWVSAEELEAVLPDKKTKKEDTESENNTAIQTNTSPQSHSRKNNPTISKRITNGINKLETELGKQFQIEVQKGKHNRDDRPIQRRDGGFQTDYRLRSDYLNAIKR